MFLKYYVRQILLVYIHFKQILIFLAVFHILSQTDLLTLTSTYLQLEYTKIQVFLNNWLIFIVINTHPPL